MALLEYALAGGVVLATGLAVRFSAPAEVSARDRVRWLARGGRIRGREASVSTAGVGVWSMLAAAEPPTFGGACGTTHVSRRSRLLRNAPGLAMWSGQVPPRARMSALSAVVDRAAPTTLRDRCQRRSARRRWRRCGRGRGHE